jgi:hypothetical protein
LVERLILFLGLKEMRDPKKEGVCLLFLLI